MLPNFSRLRHPPGGDTLPGPGKMAGVGGGGWGWGVGGGGGVGGGWNPTHFPPGQTRSERFK